MVEVSIDPQTGSAVLISIPRSLERAPFPSSNPLHKLFPNGYYCPNAAPGNECLINGVWSVAEDNKNLFKNDPNPGLTTIRDVIGEVTGLHVDYSTVIDLAGCRSRDTTPAVAVSPASRAGSSQAPRSSTATTHSGMRARACSPTTSPGCAASGASSARCSTRSTP